MVGRLIKIRQHSLEHLHSQASRPNEALLAMRLQRRHNRQPQLALCLGGMAGIKASAASARDDLFQSLCYAGLRRELVAGIANLGQS
jgi:hypothetical protein